MQRLTDNQRDLAITGVLFVVALVLTSFTGWVTFDNPSAERTLQAELKELESRTIISYMDVEGDANTLVPYTYRGERVPEKLAPDEVVAKRTESSWTRLLGYKNKGTAQEELILSVNTYAQPAFSLQPDGWYYIEYDEATKGALKEHQKQNPVQALFWNVAHAVDFFSGTGDGVVQNGSFANCSTDWTTLHDAATGNSASTTSLPMIIGSSALSGKINSCTIVRGFFPFDTSSIPAGATVTAATVTFEMSAAASNTDNDGTDYITIVQTSQATHTDLTNADYDQCGAITSPTEGIATGNRIDITTIVGAGDVTFTLNATGQGWIKKSGQASNCSATTGITCLGVREGHDTTNAAVVGQNTVNIYPSEQTGTASDPLLAVTYTSASTAFWQFQDF